MWFSNTHPLHISCFAVSEWHIFLFNGYLDEKEYFLRKVEKKICFKQIDRHLILTSWIVNVKSNYDSPNVLMITSMQTYSFLQMFIIPPANDLRLTKQLVQKIKTHD